MAENAHWVTTGEANGSFYPAGTPFGPHGARVDDMAYAFSADSSTIVIEGSADQLVRYFRRAYLNALRAGGRADEAELVLRATGAPVKTPEGVTYHPWVGANGEIGYRAVHDESGEAEHTYLVASRGDSAGQPNVFLYQGEPGGEPVTYVLVHAERYPEQEEPAQAGAGFTLTRHLDPGEVEVALITLAELANCQGGLDDPDDVLSERQQEVAQRLAGIHTALLAADSG